MAQSDLLGRATFELYTADPGSFMARRTELAREARSAGAKDEAKAIAGIRKPQRSASILNRYAAAEPDRIADLLQLGADLRRAERDLDGRALRELSTMRRRLVADVVRAAMEFSAASAASGAVQEELTATLNAAIADDQVGSALQQSSLTQPAEWSGFGSGFTADGPAVLSVVRDAPAPAAVRQTEPIRTKRIRTEPPNTTTAPTEPAQTAPVMKTQAPSKKSASTRAPTPSRQDRETRAAQARKEREAKLRGDAQVARERAEATRKKRDDAGTEAAAALAAAASAVAEAAESLRVQQDKVADLVADLDRARKRLQIKELELQQAQQVQRTARLAADRIRRHLHSE